jgi:hypothetical protein
MVTCALFCLTAWVPCLRCTHERPRQPRLMLARARSPVAFPLISFRRRHVCRIMGMPAACRRRASGSSNKGDGDAPILRLREGAGRELLRGRMGLFFWWVPASWRWVLVLACVLGVSRVLYLYVAGGAGCEEASLMAEAADPAQAAEAVCVIYFYPHVQAVRCGGSAAGAG